MSEEFDACALRAREIALAKLAAKEAKELMRLRARTVDVTAENGHGAQLLELVQQLAAERMTKGYRRPSLLVPTALELSVWPRPGHGEPEIFRLPEGATLARHANTGYSLDAGPLSMRFELTGGRLKLLGDSGFRTDKGRALRHPSGRSAMRVVHAAS